MNLWQVILQLSPEWIMLVGLCAVLLVGMIDTAPRAKWSAPFALLILLAALAMTLYLGEQKNVQPLPGLLLNSLSFYARWVTLSIGSLIILVNWVQPAAVERGEYMSLILSSILGVLLTAEANDLVVLFFAVELVSIPTYVLIALSRTEFRASEAAVKYFFLGALSAAILAYGIALLYGVAGQTAIHHAFAGNMQSIIARAVETPLGIVGLLLVFAGLFFKIAAVPFHVYVADVYEGAAAPITGMLGFVPKFAGFLALLKLLTSLQWNLPDSVSAALWLVAAATMTVGNVLALMQKNVKRMLAYSSVSHTGYMLVALLAGPIAGDGPLRDGVSALLFYIAIYGVMNLGAFAALAWLRSGDRETETLEELAGLARVRPAAALALAVCVISLTGLPPTAGFVGKLYVIGSAFSVRAGHPMQMAMYTLAIIAVINTAIGAAYYFRIVAAAYMGAPTVTGPRTVSSPVGIGLAMCAIPMLILFALPDPLARQSYLAARSVHDMVGTSAAQMTAAGSIDNRQSTIDNPFRFGTSAGSLLNGVDESRSTSNLPHP